MSDAEESVEAVARLVRLLDLEDLDVNLYRGSNPNTWPGGRVFGGLVASQALRAAMSTVEVSHQVHSLHAYFLRPGQPGVPMIFHVDRIRDGRSFTTRNVTAMQKGEAIFSMSSSFHKDGEDGIDYQLARPLDAPDPDALDDRSGGFPMRTSFFAPSNSETSGPPSPHPTAPSARPGASG